MRKVWSVVSSLCLVALVISLFGGGTARASGLPYPRLANYYLGTINSPTNLSRWDLVVAQANQSQYPAFTTMRSHNPNINILAYIASEEPTVALDAPRPDANIPAKWLLQNSSGTLIHNSRNQVYNLSAASPKVNGETWVDHLAAWTVNRFGSSHVDGVFYDNAWGSVDWLSNSIDEDRNFVNDFSEHGTSWVNSQWESGLLSLMSQTRAGLAAGGILIGNGNAQAYNTNNGRMNEGFDRNYDLNYGGFGWVPNYKDYMFWDTNHHGPNYYILNYTPELGPNGQFNYQQVRFYLGTTLLGDGYFSFDESVANHDQLWWYDEYSVDLNSGRATGDASHKGYLGQPTGESFFIGNGLYERDFDNGIVLVNPSNSTVTVNMPRSYRRIIGTQDPGVENGRVSATITVNSQDAAILLK